MDTLCDLQNQHFIFDVPIHRVFVDAKDKASASYDNGNDAQTLGMIVDQGRQKESDEMLIQVDMKVEAGTKGSKVQDVYEIKDNLHPRPTFPSPSIKRRGSGSQWQKRKDAEQ